MGMWLSGTRGLQADDIMGESFTSPAELGKVVRLGFSTEETLFTKLKRGPEYNVNEYYLLML